LENFGYVIKIYITISSNLQRQQMQQVSSAKLLVGSEMQIIMFAYRQISSKVCFKVKELSSKSITLCSRECVGSALLIAKVIAIIIADQSLIQNE